MISLKMVASKSTHSKHFSFMFCYFDENLNVLYDIWITCGRLFSFQLKGSQEPKAKKSRRTPIVEPKEEASVRNPDLDKI